MSQYIIERGNSAWPTTDDQWEIMYHRLTKPGANRFIYFLHGGGGYAQEFTLRDDEHPPIGVPLRATLHMLADNGYVILNSKHGDGYTFGNDLSLGLMEDWVDYMLNTYPMTQGGTKVALMGISMGHSTAVNYALRHTGQVIGGLGVVPLISLDYHYHGGVEGNALNGWLPNEINMAFGLPAGPPDSNNAPTLDTTVRNERDPLTRAAELNGLMPWHIYYNTDDNTADSANNGAAFATAAGATSTVGTGGHFEWDVDDSQVLSFFNGLAWS